MLARVLMLSCLLPSATALAGDHHATLVGLGSLGGEVAFGVGGAAVGLGIGGASCGADAFECWGPLIGASLGFTSGVVAGGFVGSGVTAHLTHERPGRALLGTGVGLAAGLGLVALGEVAYSGEVMALGVGVAVVGMPLGGALGVATDHRVTVVPEARKGGAGFRIAGTF